MALEAVAAYMELQMQFARGNEMVAERARSLYCIAYLLGIVDATCQHCLIEQQSQDGMRIAAAAFSAVFDNADIAEKQFGASIAAQETEEHQGGVIAGGEEMFRFLSGETLGILGLSAFLAMGRRRKPSP
jgi:hypothetical protein